MGRGKERDPEEGEELWPAFSDADVDDVDEVSMRTEKIGLSPEAWPEPSEAPTVTLRRSEISQADAKTVPRMPPPPRAESYRSRQFTNGHHAQSDGLTTWVKRDGQTVAHLWPEGFMVRCASEAGWIFKTWETKPPTAWHDFSATVQAELEVQLPADHRPSWA